MQPCLMDEPFMGEMGLLDNGARSNGLRQVGPPLLSSPLLSSPLLSSPRHATHSPAFEGLIIVGQETGGESLEPIGNFEVGAVGA